MFDNPAMDETAEKAIKVVRSIDDVVVVSHTDSDGVCGAAILEEMFRRRGVNVEAVYHIEKTYAEIVERIYSKHKGSNVVWCDLGSEKMRRIAEACQESKGQTIILDHHTRDRTNDDKIVWPGNLINLNCEDYGVRSESFLSASSIAYIFAEGVLGRVPELAHLAMIGSMDDHGCLEGLDYKSFDDARDHRDKQGKIMALKQQGKYVISWADFRQKGYVGYERVRKIGSDTTLYVSTIFFNQQFPDIIKTVKQVLRDAEQDSQLKRRVKTINDDFTKNINVVYDAFDNGHPSVIVMPNIVYVNLSSSNGGIIDTSDYAVKYAGLIAEGLTSHKPLEGEDNPIKVVMVGQRTGRYVPLLGNVFARENTKISYRPTQAGVSYDLAELITETKKAFREPLNVRDLSTGSHKHKAALTVPPGLVPDIVEFTSQFIGNYSHR